MVVHASTRIQSITMIGTNFGARHDVEVYTIRIVIDSSGDAFRAFILQQIAEAWRIVQEFNWQRIPMTKEQFHTRMRIGIWARHFQRYYSRVLPIFWEWKVLSTAPLHILWAHPMGRCWNWRQMCTRSYVPRITNRGPSSGCTSVGRVLLHRLFRLSMRPLLDQRSLQLKVRPDHPQIPLVQQPRQLLANQALAVQALANLLLLEDLAPTDLQRKQECRA